MPWCLGEDWFQDPSWISTILIGNGVVVCNTNYAPPLVYFVISRLLTILNTMSTAVTPSCLGNDTGEQSPYVLSMGMTPVFGCFRYVVGDSMDAEPMGRES